MPLEIRAELTKSVAKLELARDSLLDALHKNILRHHGELARDLVRDIYSLQNDLDESSDDPDLILGAFERLAKNVELRVQHHGRFAFDRLSDREIYDPALKAIDEAVGQARRALSQNG